VLDTNNPGVFNSYTEVSGGIKPYDSIAVKDHKITTWW